MRWISNNDADATLDDVREAVTTLQDAGSGRAAGIGRSQWTLRAPLQIAQTHLGAGFRS